jgi:hypothetical protein
VTVRRTIGLLILTGLVLGAGPGSAWATGSSEFGVVAQDRLAPAEYGEIEDSGAGTLRVGVVWSSIEPRPGQLDLDYLDSVVSNAAEHGIRVLPFIYGSPGSVTGSADRPPIYSAYERRLWADLLQTLVRRYGPGGELWEHVPNYEPITSWQIWNEPNIKPFWDPAPSARGYARLLRVSARAIHDVDRDAEIVLAGLSPAGRHYVASTYLRDLYRVGRVKPYFDAVALHPYAGELRGVRKQIEQARRVMGRFGNGHTKIDMTELGWASDGDPRVPLVKTEAGQAQLLDRAFDLLSRKRQRWNIGQVFWFAWRDLNQEQDTCGFCRYSGLLTLDGRRKQAWAAFRSWAGE